MKKQWPGAGKKIVGTLIVGSLAMATVGFTVRHKPKPKPTPYETIDVETIIQNNGINPNDKSDLLVKKAELLMSPISFMYADKILDEALYYNPENWTAQLLKAINAPMMQMKGILKRIQPLAFRSAQNRRDYEQSYGKLPASGLTTFLFAGQPNIRTAADAQKVADALLQSENKLRNYLKYNKNLRLSLTVPYLNDAASMRAAIKDCGSTEIRPNVFQVKKCSEVKMITAKLNRADLESMQQITAGLEIYTTLYTIYNLDGAVAANARFTNSGAKGQTVMNFLFSHPKFGRLRNWRDLWRIKKLGLDAVSGAQWAMKLQRQLCPKGLGAENRPGNLLYGGICINPNQKVDKRGNTLASMTHLIQLAILGQTVGLHVNEGITAFKPVAFINNPVHDLRTLHPKWNSCGTQIISTSDDTLDGVFPDHNANRIMSEMPGADCSNQK